MDGVEFAVLDLVQNGLSGAAEAFRGLIQRQIAVWDLGHEAGSVRESCEFAGGCEHFREAPVSVLIWPSRIPVRSLIPDEEQAVQRGDDGWTAAPTGGRGSNLISTVSRANGLAIVPSGVETARAGESVHVLLFRSAED